MARSLGVAVPGAWYHVMARGIDRRTIFLDEVYYRKFEGLLSILPERFGVRLHTYVLMPNHYHLQIETPRLNLSAAIRWLNLSYVAWFNRKNGRSGPLLQGRFKGVVHDLGRIRLGHSRVDSFESCWDHPGGRETVG